MKTTDVRIGNLIYDSYCGYLVISAINERSVLAHTPGMVTSGYFDIEKIYPVKLTEDFFLKNGFKKLEKALLFPKTTLDATFAFFEAEGLWVLYLWDMDASGWGIVGVEIQFAHQLQNLYYALASEELQITF